MTAFIQSVYSLSFQLKLPGGQVGHSDSGPQTAILEITVRLQTAGQGYVAKRNTRSCFDVFDEDFWPADRHIRGSRFSAK
jgi:hypothetical protein